MIKSNVIFFDVTKEKTAAVIVDKSSGGSVYVEGDEAKTIYDLIDKIIKKEK